MTIKVHPFFDDLTSTFSYVVADTKTHKATIIDSVLNYDPDSGRCKTQSADYLIEIVKDLGYNVQWILDTHIHADHLTASSYIKSKLGGRIGIGSKIIDVLNYWVPVFNTFHDTPLDGSQFDMLLNDGDSLPLGESFITILHTPGHTPACASYVIDDCVFVGDTIFMPDVGTARTDFPGGDARTFYRSIQKLFHLPGTTRLFMCHDYPPNNGRPISYETTIGIEKQDNIMVHTGITEDEFVQLRTQKDIGKSVPKLLLPSIQVNMRAGQLGSQDSLGRQYIKIPINTI